MKKYLLVFSFFSLLISCSGDNSKEEQEIIEEIGLQLSDIQGFWSDGSEDLSSFISLSEDGSYKMFNYSKITIDAGTYKITDGKLSCRSGFSNEETIYNVNVSSTSLILSSGNISCKYTKKEKAESSATDHSYIGRQFIVGGYTIGGIGHTDGRVDQFYIFNNKYSLTFSNVKSMNNGKNTTTNTAYNYIIDTNRNLIFRKKEGSVDFDIQKYTIEQYFAGPAMELTKVFEY